MKLRFIRISAALTTLVVVLSCGGADGLAPAASDNSAKVPASDATLLAGLTASGPVANASIGSNRGSVNASVGPSAEVSWVSLIPGTVPEGTTATIVNLRTAHSLTTAIVDGGFDPQPMSASLGDTIQVTVSRVGKPDAGALLSVARPAPRLVRTRPPRGQTDAPLNMIITLVFSEPLDAASVNPTTITLTTAGSPVAGAVQVLPRSGYVVEFAPAALLKPSTAYVLTMDGVVNLAGTSLSPPMSIPFTTTAVDSDSGDASYSGLLLNVDDVGLITGDTVPMRGYVYRGGRQSTEALEWTISDPSVASIRPMDAHLIEVRAVRRGGVTISARTLGSAPTLSARASVKVFARSSQPSPIVVDQFSILETAFSAPTYTTYAPNLRLRDTSATGSARVIGITIDLPGADHRLSCVANRVLGTATWNVFPPFGDQNGYFLARQDFQRLPDIAVDATVHVTAVLSDGRGVSSTVTGKVVPDSSTWSWAETGIYPPPCEYLAPR